ncbi:Hypothetical predicted protein [Podarcis lilfordi]|uniref:Uncharacterized protein n=1 Tax=Podarcis lilfordi TaxID=74358 RepID=A0AA35KEI2_9SAUR|nr:Hypothetical predicted protein [Podarcis lilfordi]
MDGRGRERGPVSEKIAGSPDPPTPSRRVGEGAHWAALNSAPEERRGDGTASGRPSILPRGKSDGPSLQKVHFAQMRHGEVAFAS